LPLPAGAQSIEWKAIACTYERPDWLRGNILNFSFSDDGLVEFAGKQRDAMVTTFEIVFCLPSRSAPTDCYTISRVSGRFEHNKRGAIDAMNGTCLPASQKPKF
jgi:hypothetical protein